MIKAEEVKQMTTDLNLYSGSLTRDAAADMLESLLAERDAYALDAKRYRWMKMRAQAAEQTELVMRTSWTKWDDTIDALAAQGETK